jgi:L,D-transpeptidase catalytic domain
MGALSRNDTLSRFGTAAALAFAIGCGGGESPSVPPAHGLPFRWFLVQNPVKTAQRELAPGFGVAAARELVVAGERMIRTTRGEDVALRDLAPVEPLRFTGAVIDGGRVDFGWVVERSAPVWSSPDASGRPVSAYGEFNRVVVAGEDGPPGWVRVGGGWMKRAQLRIPRVAPRPGGVAPTERWIDVDADSETLIAYEGDRPLFATLVSTGSGAPGMPLSTPRGVFRVYAKWPSAKMDNVDHPNVPHYSFDEVPFVQFFNQEIALHGAFWHRRFGHPVSHGCVNVPPLDADRLYQLTKIGAVVRVR